MDIINNPFLVGHFHLSHTHDNTEGIMNLFKKFSYVAVCKECNINGDNQHYHIVACDNNEELPIKPETIKTNIRSNFPHLKREKKEDDDKDNRGGGHGYSVKLSGGKHSLLLDENEAREYQCYYNFKEVDTNNEPLLKGITFEDSIKYKKRFNELKKKNEQLLKDKKRINTKKENSIINELCDKVKDRSSMLGVDCKSYLMSNLILDNTIDVVTEFYKEQKLKKVMNNNRFKDQVFTIMFHLHDGFREQFTDNIKTEFKNNYLI